MSPTRESLHGRINVVRLGLELPIARTAASASARARSVSVCLLRYRLLAPALARPRINRVEGGHGNAVHHLHIGCRGVEGVMIGGGISGLDLGMLGRTPPFARGCVHAS